MIGNVLEGMGARTRAGEAEMQAAPHNISLCAFLFSLSAKLALPVANQLGPLALQLFLQQTADSSSDMNMKVHGCPACHTSCHAMMQSGSSSRPRVLLAVGEFELLLEVASCTC